MNDRASLKTLEEVADALLDQMARNENKSLREMGIINKRRDRTVREREIPFSSAFARRRKERNR